MSRRRMREKTTKTYVSIPDDLLGWYEAQSMRQDLARSVLFAEALREYHDKHRAGRRGGKQAI